MNKKGIAWASLVIIIIILVSFVIIFGWQLLFGEYIKKEGEATTCKLSVIRASINIGSLKEDELPKLACPKIPVEIESKNEEDIKKELLDLIVMASKDFGASRVTYSKISGKYCRRRYHPITFKKKDLEIKGFNDYFQKNKPKGLVGDFSIISDKINTTREYSILFVVVYDTVWDKFWKDAEKGAVGAYAELALVGLGYRKLGSRYLGFAFVKSDEILGALKCDHLI